MGRVSSALYRRSPELVGVGVNLDGGRFTPFPTRNVSGPDLLLSPRGSRLLPSPVEVKTRSPTLCTRRPKKGMGSVPIRNRLGSVQ